MSIIVDDNGKEISTTQELLKSESDDNVKFGLLNRLIKANDVADKDVVDTVFNLVSL